MASTDLKSCHNSVLRDITIFTPLCVSLSPGRYMYKWVQMKTFQGNPVMDKHFIKGVVGGGGEGGGVVGVDILLSGINILQISCRAYL